MKRLSLIIIMLLAIVISISAQRTFVLLTGVSNYGDDKINLHNTTKDVKELRQMFKRQNATVTVLTSKYANKANITEKLRTLAGTAGKEDKIIFYFSGHGQAGGFIPYGKTLFTYTELIRILAEAKTDKVFCFMDACMSGSVAQPDDSGYSWGQTPAGRKLTFCMSSRADELSMENSWLGNGYFTQAMVKGLRGKADANGDRSITMAELYAYVYNDVTKRTKNDERKQHPQLIGPKSNFGVVLTRW